MNKSLFKKLFVPIVIIGIIVILIVSLVATPEDSINSLIVGLIIWIPVWAIISLALTILDQKKNLNLEDKISGLIGNLKNCKPKTPKIKEEEQKPSEIPAVKEADPYDVQIEEIELGVYNIDFGDVVTQMLKIDKPISSVVVFENEDVKNDFKAFCDNGFKPVDKKVKQKETPETEPFIIKKPVYVIKKPAGAPTSSSTVTPIPTPTLKVDNPVSATTEVPTPMLKVDNLVSATMEALTPTLKVDEPVSATTEAPTPTLKVDNPVSATTEVPAPISNVDKKPIQTPKVESNNPEVKLDSEIPIKSAKKQNSNELPELIFIPDDDATIVTQPKVETKASAKITPQKPAKEQTTKKSPFKIQTFKFNPRNKTIEKNEEAIFNPVAMKPKELDLIDKPSKSVITDERLIKIVKCPETMTPAELNMIKSNQDLKKRYYEFMSALFDEDD